MADGFAFQDLIDALIQRESRGDPMAVSKRGAIGLMQIMPQHAGDLYGQSAPSVFDEARSRGFDVPDESVETARGLLMDPEINRALGEPYLRDLMRAYGGDIDMALRAYNAGPISVNKMIEEGRGPASLGQQARDYPGYIREIFREATGEELPKTMDTKQLTRPKARAVGLLGM